jgi:hypothetical protein
MPAIIDGSIGSQFPTTIGVGNATPSTSGAGITFPATQSASTDANTLDDYEEGTWTPVVTFGGNAVAQTGTLTGFYTKIGNIVTISCYIGLSAKGSSTGTAEVRGLPFTINSADGAYAAVALYLSNITVTDYPKAFGIVNTTRIYLAESTNAGVGTELTNADFANNSEVMVNLTYRVA